MNLRGKVTPRADGELREWQPRRRRDSPPPRALPIRGWIGAFLLINIFGIITFIFTSALYFPSTSPTGMVEHAIKQGDMSLLELPPRPTASDPSQDTARHATDPDNEKRERASENLGHKDEDVASSALSNTQGTFSGQPTAQVHELRSQLRRESIESPTTRPPKGTVRTSSEPQVMTTYDPTTPPLTTDPVAHSLTPASTPTTPPPQSSAQHVNDQERQQSMVELLRRMKTKDRTVANSVAPEETAVPLHPTASATSRPAAAVVDKSTRVTAPVIDHLIMWLKADEGVEVDNPAECETLGSGCEVNLWRSVTAQPQGGNPVVFHPVDPSMRPKLEVEAQNGRPVVSFACPMAWLNDQLMHEQVTVFFVVSPSEVTPGDTYAGQKFFGNEPYGQFLLHGGKPAFYTTGGLRESQSVLKNGEFAVITYRLHRHAVHIKTNNEDWSLLGADEDESFAVHVSGHGMLGLGNVKESCDTNAFRGQIAEIMVYDSVLFDHQVTQTERYLEEKWLGRVSRKISSPRASGSMTATEVPTKGTIKTEAEPSVDPKPTHDDRLEPEITPRTFDPEGVFEWTPSQELLDAIARETDTDPIVRVTQWKTAVREKINSVRNFEFGGEVLRSFIRSRRDELLALRDDLFGNGR